MNTCDYYQELISRLVDGEVSRNEYQDLMRHMYSCSRCNAMYAVFHDLSEILQSEEPEALPEGLHENIMAGVRRSAIEKKNRRMRATWVRTGLTAAACAVLVLFAARGLSPAGRTEGNVIRNIEEIQQVETAPVQEQAAAAEASAPTPAPAAAETEKPVQTPSPTPVQTQAPVRTQAPVQTQAPVRTPMPAQTKAPVQTPDPYLNQTDDTGGQSANTAPVPAATAAPVPKTTPAPAVTAAASAPETAPVEATAAAQSPAPAETTQDLPGKTDATADTARNADSGAVPPAALQAALPAESPEAPAETVTADVADLLPDSGTGETAAFVDSSAVQETPTEAAEEAAPKSFLKSFRTLLRSPAPALAIPMEETEEPSAESATAEQPAASEKPAESPAVSAAPLPSPSATPAKESSFRLSGKENQKKLTDLLGGEAKTLPKTEADAIVNVTFVPEDPFGGEEELSIRYYGDEVYYVTYPEGKEPKSFLADCDAAELKSLIRELRGDKTPAESPAVSPAVSPAATADPFLPDVPEGS